MRYKEKLKIEKLVRDFRNGYSVADLRDKYIRLYGTLSHPGMIYKLKSYLGETEYNKIRQANIKHPKHQIRYAQKKLTANEN